jgi:hypothetical protein
MTWRIDRLSTEQGLVLYISGRLAAEDLDVVRTALDGGRVVAIELRSCPAYIREWMTNERANSQRSE